MKPSKPVRTTMKSPQAAPKPYELRLYVAGQTPKFLIALANLKKICEEQLHSKYRIELIDRTAPIGPRRSNPGDTDFGQNTAATDKKNHRRSVKYRASSSWTQPETIGLTDL